MSVDFTNGLFTLAGAVVGSLITGAISWYINRQNRQRSELTVLKGAAVRLIAVHSKVSSVVEINVNGTSVPTVYTQDIKILNTGTNPIKCGNVAFTADEGAKILAPAIVTYPSGGADALTVITANAGITVSFTYINPDEEYLLRIILDKSADVTATFRQEGVKFVFRPYFDSTMPALLGDALAVSIRRISLLHVLCWLLIPRYRRYWPELR